METDQKKSGGSAVQLVPILDTNPNHNTSDSYVAVVNLMDTLPIFAGMNPEEVRAMKAVYSYGTEGVLRQAIHDFKLNNDQWVASHAKGEAEMLVAAGHLQEEIGKASVLVHKTKMGKVAEKERQSQVLDTQQTVNLEEQLNILKNE